MAFKRRSCSPTHTLVAKELLKRENLKVAEVGSLIGYVTPQSFTRFFKK